MASPAPPPDRTRRVATIALVAAVAVVLGALTVAALVTQDRGGRSRGTADCVPLIRLDGAVYRQNSYLDYRPTRSAGVAERSQCDDNGPDAAGSHFAENPEHVTAWFLTDEDANDVVGIQEAEDLLAVYVRVGTPASRIEETLDRLRHSGPSTGP